MTGGIPPWPEPDVNLPGGLGYLKLEEREVHGSQPFNAPKDAVHPPWKPPPSIRQHCQLPTLAPDRLIYSHPPGRPSQPFPHPASAYTGVMHSEPATVYPPLAATGVPQSMRPPSHLMQSPICEQVYRGPKPTIPKFVHSDPSEFARLCMALENLLPSASTELFKYQILVDILKLEDAKLIADAYLNSPTPYTDRMKAHREKYGQPHQLALRKIASVLEAPEVKRGDTVAFQKFSLQIQSLVGMLQTLGPEGAIELKCGSHVARLLSKLPVEQRADFSRNQVKQPGTISTLYDLSEWLRYGSWCQGFDSLPTGKSSKERQIAHSGKQTVAVLHGAREASETATLPHKESSVTKNVKNKAYCPYCESTEHYLSQCSDVSRLSKDELREWIQVNKRCWRCSRNHQAAQCTLKKPCNFCQ